MGTEYNAIAAAPIFGPSGLPVAGKIFAATTTTTTGGAWSMTIPAGIFTAVPAVSPMAVSADNTLANQASVQMTAPTIANGVVTLSGTVTLPNTITVGGSPNKAAGAGVSVMVIAVES